MAKSKKKRKLRVKVVGETWGQRLRCLADAIFGRPGSVGKLADKADVTMAEASRCMLKPDPSRMEEVERLATAMGVRSQDVMQDGVIEVEIDR